jgi:hypothetical protein
LLVVQPHDSPAWPTHAFASFPMKTHAVGSHDPPPDELLLDEDDDALLDEDEEDDDPLLDEDDDPLLDDELPLPLGQSTASHSAGTALGVQPGSLVCAWRHWYVAPS